MTLALDEESKKAFMTKKVAVATKKSSSKTGAKKKSAAKKLHVVPQTGGWVIRSEGSSRAKSLHGTQREAVEAARTLAKSKATTLVIHGRDGRVKAWDSYSPDPLPPRKPREVLFPTTTPRTASREAIKRAVSEAVSEAARKEFRETKGSNRIAPKSEPGRESKEVLRANYGARRRT
jgi:hypothetical protein